MIEITQLKNLFDGANLKDLKKILIDEISRNLQQITPNWHPLGFIHAKLAGDVNETYRLHIWPADLVANQPQQHKIHDHLFDVESIILAGAVENIEYDVAPSTQSPTHRILRVEYLAKGPKLYEDGSSCSISLNNSKIISSDSRYKIEKYTLHETLRSSSNTAITFVRTSNPSDYHPRVVVPIDSPLPPTRPQITLSRNHWLELIKKQISDQ